MNSVAELRMQLQGPRVSVDTWYGRNVMRRFSIYFTWVFAKLGCSPNTATSLSLLCALLGGVFLSRASWGPGILLINLWYLLDHVDGELARLSGKASAAGLFYDTAINFLVQPLTFLGLGWGLSQSAADPYFLFGVLGALGYLILNLIPMSEASIVLEIIQRCGVSKEPVFFKVEVSHTGYGFRTLFAAWHKAVTFPNFLMALSAAYPVTVLMVPDFTRPFLMGFLVFYSVSCTVVWGLQLFWKVYSKKLDAHPWIAGGEVK